MSLSRSLAQATYQQSLNVGAEQALAQTKEFMVKHKLEALLPIVRAKLEYILEEKNDGECIHIQSAAPLTDDVRENIQRAHHCGTDVTCIETLNDSLLAGFISEYKGILIDTSLHTIISNVTTKRYL